MRLLTENEIRFFKETGVTPTVMNIGGKEWYHTEFCDEIDENFLTGEISNEKLVYEHACKVAKERYNVDLNALYDKCYLDQDGISLEDEAPYIIYCLLTEEELDKKSDKELVEWLQDWKYYSGYRKWDEWAARIARYEAKGLYNGAREIYTYDDGSIYISGLEEDD